MSDGYQEGDWNVTCYECGRKKKASTMKKHWQGYWVCPQHWEARQEQDFVRAVADTQTVPWSQPQKDMFVTFCTPNALSAIVDYGVVDCMVAGWVSPDFDPTFEPPDCIPLVIAPNQVVAWTNAFGQGVSWANTFGTLSLPMVWPIVQRPIMAWISWINTPIIWTNASGAAVAWGITWIGGYIPIPGFPCIWSNNAGHVVTWTSTTWDYEIPGTDYVWACKQVTNNGAFQLDGFLGVQ